MISIFTSRYSFRPGILRLPANVRLRKSLGAPNNSESKSWEDAAHTVPTWAM